MAISADFLVATDTSWPEHVVRLGELDSVASAPRVADSQSQRGLDRSIDGMTCSSVLVPRCRTPAAPRCGDRISSRPDRPHTRSGSHSEAVHLDVGSQTTAERPGIARSCPTPAPRQELGNPVSRRAAPPSVETPPGCHRPPSPPRGHTPCIETNH